MTDLSICIITLNSRDKLRACLASIEQYPPKDSFEILVTDNASDDGTVEMLQKDFPYVKVFRNERNDGFTKPNNQMLHRAKGEFLLLLNADTELTEDCFGPQIQYLRDNPSVGVSIPKVLNEDGTFQEQSRRGEARPKEVIGYFCKWVANRYPDDRELNGYLMRWLPQDEPAEVKAVSGSCMFIRRKTWEQVGDLDERFFAYQEDSDYCMRVRKLGWKVMYVPITEIIHHGGQGGSQAHRGMSNWHWHYSYCRYYRKHFTEEYPWWINWGMYILMFLKFLYSIFELVITQPKNQKSG